MATTVRELPGVRIAARAHVYVDGSEDAFITRIDDLGDDWVAVAVSADELVDWPLGSAVEIEVPQAGGSLFIEGTVSERKVEGVPLVVVHVEHVGADPGVGDQHEQRRNYRLIVRMPLDRFTYRVGHGAWEEGTAVVADLSAGGASVVTDEDVPVGAHVRFTFPMLLEGWPCAVHGTVMMAREVGTHRHPQRRLGVRFDDLPHQIRDLLVRQMHLYQITTRR